MASKAYNNEPEAYFSYLQGKLDGVCPVDNRPPTD